MPPLLPEYLSQPIQISIQQPETSWLIELLPIAGGAIAALAGAAVSHFLSRNRERKKSRHEKLEEIFDTTEKLKKASRAYIEDFVGTVEIDESGDIILQSPLSQSKTQEMQELRNKLTFLMRVHLSDHQGLMEEVDAQINTLGMRTALRRSAGFKSRESFEEYRLLLNNMGRNIALTQNAIAEIAVSEAQRCI